MWQLALKGIISGLIVVAASEAAKRSTVAGAILVSLPLTSILALIWLYSETGSTQQVIDLSYSIMWIVLPSVVLFVALPLLLRAGLPFVAALPVSCLVMAGAYAGYAWGLGKLGVQL